MSPELQKALQQKDWLAVHGIIEIFVTDILAVVVEKFGIDSPEADRVGAMLIETFTCPRGDATCQIF